MLATSYSQGLGTVFWCFGFCGGSAAGMATYGVLLHASEVFARRAALAVRGGGGVERVTTWRRLPATSLSVAARCPVGCPAYGPLRSLHTHTTPYPPTAWHTPPPCSLISLSLHLPLPPLTYNNRHPLSFFLSFFHVLAPSLDHSVLRRPAPRPTRRSPALGSGHWRPA
jgi:hypothetical protein